MHGLCQLYRTPGPKLLIAGVTTLYEPNLATKGVVPIVARRIWLLKGWSLSSQGDCEGFSWPAGCLALAHTGPRSHLLRSPARDGKRRALKGSSKIGGDALHCAAIASRHGF